MSTMIVKMKKADLTTESLELLKAIDAYKVGEDIRDKVTDKLKGEYNKLRDTVYWWMSVGHDLTNIIGGLNSIETIWCEENYEDSPEYKHKDGSWKLRTLLPPAYSSAKAVVLKALKVGVLDNISGKSELERKIKGNTPTPVLSIDDEIRAKFEKLRDQMDDIVGEPPDPLRLGMVIGSIMILKDHYENAARRI